MEKRKKNPNLNIFPMTLNKYLAHAGLCSRRQAVNYIKVGVVKVNGVVVREPSYRVLADDNVKFKNRTVALEKMLYILLNKPKGYITTTSDERGRRTVIDLVKSEVGQRVYPVGRLDLDTTGLLLLTNDGDLAQRLSHPRYEVSKIYNVVLNEPLKDEYRLEISKGVKLEDCMISADKISYLPGKSKHYVKIQIHSGKNRVVRRIFEKFGYRVVKLDRVGYAGLTKRSLPLSRWRNLTNYELLSLKKFGHIKKKSRRSVKSEKYKERRLK